MLRRFVERRDFDLVSSREILERVERALDDPEVGNFLPSARESQRWTAALGVLTTPVEVGESDLDVGHDDEDRPYLAAIRAVGGGLVVTNDPRLLAVTDIDDIEVLTPGSLLEVLEASSRAPSPRPGAPGSGNKTTLETL